MKHLIFQSRFLILLLGFLTIGISHVWGEDVVNNISNLSAGKYYITALNSGTYYTVPNTTINGQTFTCTAGTYSSGKFTAPEGAGVFQFISTGTANQYYIYNDNLKKYLVATASQKFGYVDNSSSDYGYWTFSNVGTNAGISGKFSVQHSSKTHYMRAYSNSVRCYDGTSNNGVYLMKVADGAGSIEINPTNSGAPSGTEYNTTTFTVDKIQFGYTNWCKPNSSTNNGKIQAKKSTTNSLYNVDAIPGIIKSITIVQTGTARAIKVYGGTSTKPTTEITAPTTAATMTFDFSGKEYTYFSMKTPGDACYFDKITITYAAAPAATPTINKTADLSNFTYEVENGPSAAQSFIVSGSNLTADITVTAPTDFEVSKSSGTGYASSVSLTPSSGSVDETTIFVRMKSGLTQGTGKGGDITLSSTGATSQTIAVTGSVTAPAVHRAVTWYVNNVVYTTGNPTIDVVDGQKVTTLPTEPTSEDVSSTTFMGWTDNPITAKQVNPPTLLFKTVSAAPTISGANASYYAVFAKESSEEEPITATFNATGLTTGTYKTGTKNDDKGYQWSYYAAVTNQSGTLYYGLNSNASNYNIGSPKYEGNITAISLKAYNGSGSEARKLLLCSNNLTAQPSEGDLAEVTINKSESFSTTYNFNLSGAGSFSQFYIYAAKPLGVSEVKVTYSPVYYSDYTTAFTLPTYSITFDGNGATSGSMSAIENITKGGNQTITKNAFEKIGYSFTGWKDQDNNPIADEATISNITKNITLTAQWEANTIYVNLDKNGSEEDGLVTVVYDATSIEEIVHVADWAAHELQGYFTESTGGSKVLNADGTFADNVVGWIADGKWVKAEDATLYAQWLAQQKCTFTDYDLDGCTADPNNVTEVDVNAEDVTLNYILADNHTWTGTETVITMGTADLTEGTDYTFITGTITFLIPITGNINVMVSCPWSPATLTLSAIEHEYSFGDGLKVNNEITLPTTVNYQASGKTFVGWSSEVIATEGNEPTSNYWAKGANYTIQSTTDKLYAVYATENKGAESWNVATSVSQLNDGDIVALSSQGSYSSGGTVNFCKANAGKNPDKGLILDTDITFDNTNPTLVETGGGNIVGMTLGGNATGGWTLYLPDGGYLNGKGAKNEIAFVNVPTRTISIAINATSYEATMKFNGSDSVLCYNPNSGDGRFSLYNSTQKAIKLLKQNVEPSTFDKYTTSGSIHVDAPTFDDLTKPGTFTDADHLVIINVPTSATVHYTLNGDDPTEASATYDENEGITLTATATIKAKAFIEGIASEMLEGTFTIHNYNSVAALINGAEHNKAAVLNLNDVYVLGVYTTAKQIFVQEGTKGAIITLSETVPEDIKAGVKLTANVSGTYIFTDHNRPQMNGCTLSNISTFGENQRPASIPVLGTIDATTAADNLLTLVQINNVYSVSKSYNDIVMNSASDETGTSYNVNNLLGAVKNTLPEKELACNVIGIFYKKISNNVEEYSIVPVLESDFATASPQLTILPTLDVYGGAEDSPLAVAPNKQLTFTRVEFELESSKYKSYYQIGTSAPVEVTAKTTTITLEGNNEDIVKLKIYSTRPYYTTNEAEYFYKIDESKIEYKITYSGVQSYVGVSGAKSACAGAIVELIGTRKVEHYYPGDVTVTKTDDESEIINVTRTEVSATEATYSFEMPAYPVTVKIGYTKDPTYSIDYQTGGKTTTGGTKPTEDAKYEGEEVTLKPNTWTVNNFTFDKWKVVYETGDAEPKEQHEVEVNDGKFIMPPYAVKVIAQWIPTYIVTYDKGAATSATGSVTEEPQIEGAVITLKANAFKATGYSFIGWKASTDEQIYQPGAEFTMPAQAVTFTAQWDAAEYKKDGTWELVTSEDQLEVGKFYVIGNSQYGKTMTSTSTGSTNKRLTAVETVYSDDIVVGEKSIIKKSDLPEETVIFQLGKESDAWTFMNVATEQYYHTGDHSNPEWLTTENKALWSLNYTLTKLTMKAIHGSYTSDSTLQYYHDANSASNCGFRPYTSSQKAIQLYRFYPTARKVYFSANAGEDIVTNMPDWQRANPSTNMVTIPNVTPKRTGYTFTKWNSATTGQGTRSAQPNETIELWQAECTLHAIWAKNTPLLTIADVEHGTIQAKPYSMDVINEGGSANVEYQKTIVISHTDNDEEYAFKTWKIYKTGDESVVIEPVVGQTSTTFDMPDYPVTVSAIYESKTSIEYTLTYDANGGEGTMTGNPFTQHWNDYITVSDNKDGDNDIFTKTLCTFDGWNTKADGTGASYAAGAHFYMKSDVTLYAQWKGSGATYYLDKLAEGNIRVKEGAAPQGSTATCVNTYTGNIDQVTVNNTLTITLSGYAGKVVTNITANIKANYSGNSGKLDITVGGVNVFDKTYEDLEAQNKSQYQERSFADYGFGPVLVKENEDIVILVRSLVDNSAYIQNITIEYCEPEILRDELTVDHYTTICLPKTIPAKAYTGATFWNIENKTTMTDGRLSSITIVQHEGDLEAGVPYIMYNTATEFKCYQTGEAIDAPAADGNNGLVGVFEDTPFGNFDGDAAAVDAAAAERGYYVISNGILYLCGNNCGVYANYAYIVNGYITDQSANTPPTAPRRVIGRPNGTPTTLNGLFGNQSGKAQKALIDGHIYILRENKMYNAQSQLVK